MTESSVSKKHTTIDNRNPQINKLHAVESILYAGAAAGFAALPLKKLSGLHSIASGTVAGMAAAAAFEYSDKTPQAFVNAILFGWAAGCMTNGDVTALHLPLAAVTGCTVKRLLDGDKENNRGIASHLCTASMLLPVAGILYGAAANDRTKGIAETCAAGAAGVINAISAKNMVMRQGFPQEARYLKPVAAMLAVITSMEAGTRLSLRNSTVQDRQTASLIALSSYAALAVYTIADTARKNTANRVNGEAHAPSAASEPRTR